MTDQKKWDLKQWFSNMPLKDKVASIAILLMLLFLLFHVFAGGNKGYRESPKQKAYSASQTQGKLVVMKVIARTVAYKENKMVAADMDPIKCGIVHDGSADIIVNLQQASFDVKELSDGNLAVTVELPPPQVDESTLVIQPEKMDIRIDEGGRVRPGRERAFQQLQSETKKAIVDDLKSVVYSRDILSDAQAQAFKVLKSFYRSFGFSHVEIVWKDVTPDGRNLQTNTDSNTSKQP